MKNKILSFLIALLLVLPFFASADVGFTRVKTIGDTGAELTYIYQDVNSSTTDSSGNVYLTGCYDGTVDFDPSSGTDVHIYTRGVLTNGWNNYCDAYVTKIDSSGNYVWTKTWGGETNDFVRGIAVDSSGNVYTSTMFQNTVDFDPGAGTSNITGHNDSSASQPWDWDVAVTKLDSSGNFVWVKSWGCNNTNGPTSLALDSSNNVYVSGFQGCTTDFDPGAGTTTLTASGVTAYINKLDTDGNFVWAKNFYKSALDYAAQLTIDSSNNLYLSGGFQDTVDFDPGIGTSNMTAVGAKNAYIVKLSSAGELVWAKNISEGSANAYSDYSSIDSNGNILIGGYFSGTADFDPGIGTSNMTSVGLTDGFILKLDSSGDFVWAKQVGGTSDDNVNSLSNDNLDNIYIMGKFKETADFDPGIGSSNLTSNGDIDLFILKLDSSGDFVWVKQIGGSGIDNISYGLSVLSEDTLNIGGSFRTTVDFDPTAGISSKPSAGDADIFLVRLDPANTTPSTVTFTTQTDKNASTTYSSNTITLAGINTGAAISISGCSNASACEYSLNGAVFTSNSGTVVNGDTVILRMTSSPLSEATSTLSLTIGTVTTTYTVTNAAFASVPVFILQAQSNALRVQENNTVVLLPKNTNNNQNTQNNNSITKFIFLKNLKYKDNNTDVKELQKFLNTNNFTISQSGAGSIGDETNYFGLATRAALIKYQITSNIKPAVGYFGPLTRALVNK